MNKWILHKALRAKYRKYALRISLVVHFIMILIFAIFFINSDIQQIEDEIEVELFKELPRQIVKKKPILKQEPEPEPPKPEMPEPEEDIPKRKEITLQKEVNVVQHKSSLEIAKLPTHSQAAIDFQQPSSINIDVDTPALETPDLATDARLAPAPDSILSPNPSGSASINEAKITKRRATGVRSPSKSTGEGITEGISKTGSGKKNGSGTGNKGDGSSTFSSIIGELTDDIITSSGGGPIDVVFVVDASGSMQDNINAVAEHLGQMVDAYKASEIDYQLGLTHFNVAKNIQNNVSQNNIRVFHLVQNLSAYKQALYGIIPNGDENALDAINQTVIQMQFRKNTIKHLILVTDEPFTSMQGHTLEHIIQLCQKEELYVNVLGNNIPDHKRLAKETGGSWHAVPQDPNINPKVTTSSQLPTNPLTIGNAILADAANMPVDVILFIDSSKSMEDKVPYITEQIDMWIRNWDIANIEYRLGVVRFRAKQGVNMVTVFKPSQTQEKIHSILKLPYSDDENLLQAILDGVQRIEQRLNVKTHFILLTDEPGDPKQHIAGTIGYLKELSVVVNVLGAADNFQQQVASQTGGVYVKMPNAHTQNNRYE